MSIIDKLSSSQKRRDQGPNIELANEIVNNEDYHLIDELVRLLSSSLRDVIKNDIVMTLMSISDRNPEMLLSRLEIFIQNLKSSSNRRVWGSMTVISNIAPFVQEQIMEHLGIILDSMNNGTVVTRDRGFIVLCVLYSNDKFRGQLFPLIIEQLYGAPDNQLGQYAERLLETIDCNHMDELEKVLEKRLVDLTNEYHINRTEKIIRRIRKKK